MARHRAQCLVIRDNKILVVKHHQNNKEYYCLPGGGIEENETPKQAAKRELMEECCVNGTKLKLICKVLHGDHYIYTYCSEIGKQEPALGEDPECLDDPILVGTEWLSLDQICERDRAFLWSAGLIYYEYFSRELECWSDDISYPSKHNE